MPANRTALRFPVLLLCVLSVPAWAACAGGNGPAGDADLQLRWTFDPNPPRVGVGEIRVDVADLAWKPRNGARVILTGIRDGVELVVDTALGEGAGRYLASDFRFEVAGDWIIRARVETPEGRWTEEEHAVEVVAGQD
jgi:hypothetical protein